MKKFFKVISVVFCALIFLIVLIFFISSGNYYVPETVDKNTDLPSLEINSYRFHSETFGNPDDQPVIILHGGPGADYRYLYALKPLSKKFFLIYYDQRGTGLSPRVPSSQLSVEQYISDLDAFADYFGKGKSVFIIGHSWGAMLASLYAGKYPHKVKGLVLAEPGFLKTNGEKNVTEGPSLSLLIKSGWSIIQSMHISDENDSHIRMDYVYSRIIAVINSEMYHLQKPLKQWRGGYAVFENMVLKIMKDPQLKNAQNFAQGVENYKNKVLFICGENSSLSGSSLQREQMKYFLKAQLAIIKNAGHYMFNENPDECIDIIENYFLDQ